MRITLTFDNGPEQGVTSEVMRVLSKFGIKATFFVLGSKIASPAAREIAVSAHSEGHWIGNHTWSHETPLGEMMDVAESVSEISRTQNLIADLSHPKKFFRPFGGGGHLGTHLLSQDAKQHLVDNEYTLALWNCVPRDWSDQHGWVENAINDIQERDWSVVVLHDLPTGAMAHLEEFVQRATELGAVFDQNFPESVTPILCGKQICNSVNDYYTAR